MTDPLTPVDCDLQNLPYMPLDVRRLRDSDLASTESPESCWAAVLLWAASWHQVPAASLPDDDRVLSNLAGYGRVVKEWLRVKDGALRGWVKCSDGRLYHPVVAEKANESWLSKQAHAHAKLNERLRKAHGKGAMLPGYDEWIAAGKPSDWTQSSAGIPPEKPILPPETVPPSAGKDESSAGIPAEIALKGNGKGKGYIKEEEIPSSSSLCSKPRAGRGDDDKPANAAEWMEVFAEQHGVDVDHRSFHDRKKFWPLAAAWTKAGVTVGQMRAACAKAFSVSTEPIAWLPAYADRVLAGMQAPPPTRAEHKSFAQQDREAGWSRWEEMTGRTHPDRIAAKPITVEMECANVVAIESH